MVRVRLIGSDGGTPCISAIGYSGKVTVTDAWQDNPVEGGRLAINSLDIEFYPPDELPNLQADEDNPVPAGILVYPVCPK